MGSRLCRRREFLDVSVPELASKRERVSPSLGLILVCSYEGVLGKRREMDGIFRCTRYGFVERTEGESGLSGDKICFAVFFPSKQGRSIPTLQSFD